MTDPESGTIAVLAEKPSVARDVAHELGATGRGDGYLYGNGYVVTWAIGHLVALAQPHEINPEWRHWRRDLLPILPKHWPLVIYENTKDQFEVVGRILNSPRVSRVVCATDAGREGELIFRYIYEASECRKPFSRLWISSLTPAAIRKGFEALRPGADYDPLADAARGRSRADWLVGMNLSRAYSLAYDEELSVGRVQTPTLAMVVERELAIRRFVSEDYLEGVTFSGGEPMQQADSLLTLMYTLRQRTPELSFGMFSGYTEYELDLGQYWTWGCDYSERVRGRIWRTIQAYLDFAVLGRFDQTQPCILPLRSSRNQVLRLFSGRYNVQDFSEQLVEVTVHTDGRAELTGFPTLGLPW